MEIVYHRNEYESIYLIYVSLENSNLTILVPEDTSDEQLQAIGQKFLEAYIITDISQVKSYETCKQGSAALEIRGE